jgi:hypothetical protein
MDFQREELEEALETLGAVLQDRRTPYELLAIGGSGLLLLGLIDRPTGDLDIIALLHGETFRKLDSLPDPLESAARQVGAALGLGERWLNTGPASLMDFGLPHGWEQRLTTRQYGGLILHLPSREDQICFKLRGRRPRTQRQALQRLTEPRAIACRVAVRGQMDGETRSIDGLSR